MPNQPTASLPLHAEDLLRAKTSLLDLDQFRVYCLELYSTIASLNHALTEMSGLSVPTIYQYQGLLRRLLARLTEAERELRNRAAEAVAVQDEAESDRRKPPDRFSRWSKNSKRRSESSPQ